jgi:hypothetical protein
MATAAVINRSIDDLNTEKSGFSHLSIDDVESTTPHAPVPVTQTNDKPATTRKDGPDVDETSPYYNPRLKPINRFVDEPRPLRVGVIGAGLAGITAGILLPAKVPGIKLTIYEKNADVVCTNFIQLIGIIHLHIYRLERGSKTSIPAYDVILHRMSTRALSRQRQIGQIDTPPATKSANTGNRSLGNSTCTNM